MIKNILKIVLEIYLFYMQSSHHQSRILNCVDFYVYRTVF